MLTSQRNEAMPVHAWLTQTHTALLSEIDAVRTASILAQVHALLPLQSDRHETAEEDRATLELQVGACLDRGIQRKDRPNEDSLFVAQGILHTCSAPPTPLALFIVADGMGGHTHGQEASQLAMQALIEYMYTSLFSGPMLPGTFLTLLREGIQVTNQKVYQRSQKERTMMGTTITAALVIGATAYVASVGDSRAYVYHNAFGLAQITHDHSVVAALVQAGVIEPDDIYTHPRRNQIYRCLGEKPDVEVDTFVVSLSDGDLLLLCSDGLWEMVRDPQIEVILTDLTSSPSQQASALVQAALAGGGADNVSVIVVRVKEMLDGESDEITLRLAR